MQRITKPTKTFLKMVLKSLIWSLAITAGLAILVVEARGVEVEPKSPVPALSPTVITVKYDAAPNSFVMVVGIINGQMYLPDVKEPEPGKLQFSGPPGQYAVMGTEAGKRFQQTVQVVGDDPGPNPPPPPPPPGKRSVVVIYESSQWSPEYAIVTQKLQEYAKQKGEPFKLVDKDARLPDGSRPEWLTEYLAKAASANLQVPVLGVVAASSNGDQVIFAKLPQTFQEAIDFVKKNGG